MTIIQLDPRFPSAIPLEAAPYLEGDVSYTEEVPIRVRWAIADAGGHSVSSAEVLITTDPDNEEVLVRVDAGETVYSVGLGEAPDPAPEQEERDDVPADAATPADAVPVAEAQAVPEEYGVDGVAELAAAVELMSRARRRGEWEAAQTHTSLLPYLIEEAYEFADAIYDGGDIVGELSDLLLQVLFHAEIAEDFNIGDVAAAFVDKLRARSPYLFEPDDARQWPVSAAEQDETWDAGRTAPRSQPPVDLPALALAEEVIRRARAAGVPDSQIPMDILCPTPGLELADSCETRTRHIAREFLAQLEEAERLYRSGAGAEGDDSEWDDDVSFGEGTR